MPVKKYSYLLFNVWDYSSINCSVMKVVIGLKVNQVKLTGNRYKIPSRLQMFSYESSLVKKKIFKKRQKKYI